MKPNFKLSSLELDPVAWRACATFADEEITITARFPFRPEYDMPFGEVRELAERRALELLDCAPRPNGPPE
ncbi:hypothetical protein D8I30_06965 [Brevundimonas naejangsanensis]|uniref:Uncharacterized protein n=1 Tax=Brevundimonas naejangsanensis TaxID=588932 RepID=A0A494RFE5_9CAUL|nr:hypothetical protein [Brevundimonas naejangsanensis]AYG94951.1 hypothetical protein D8I30_06965 [Brevundimonas naejangsanensis]